MNGNSKLVALRNQWKDRFYLSFFELIIISYIKVVANVFIHHSK